MSAASVERVAKNTPELLNERIERQMRASVARCAAGGLSVIRRRLVELENEWDVERMLETVAPTFTLTGTILGLTVNRKWFALPLLVNAFFLQHAVQGWCPPLPVLRALGFRTAAEIQRERMALKFLRGDFRQLAGGSQQQEFDTRHLLAAVGR